MATQEANNLAALIVDQLGGRVEALKLQKLMYYCNGWSLALQDRPLFTDRVEAWKHGPVIPGIYYAHRSRPSIESWDLGTPGEVEGQDRAIAMAVIETYGAKSGWALRQMTHKETPWKVAWERCEFGRRRGEEIAPDEIRSFFKSLGE